MEEHQVAPNPQGILPLPEGSSVEQYEMVEDIKIPVVLQQGTPMLKMSTKKGPKSRVFRLDAEQGLVLWESRKSGVMSIENIREMRTGTNARNYREHFKIAADCEPRWLTIIYISDGKYKTLHVVALTIDVFRMWNSTLQTLRSLRKELMSGIGNAERRQLVWEKQYWKGADASGDAKLSFEEVTKMCQRLNIYPSRDDLLKKFGAADDDNDNFLKFAEFQKFVGLLKGRPDVERLYKEYAPDGSLEYFGFENFMRNAQKSTLPAASLQLLFKKYAVPTAPAPTSAPPPPPLESDVDGVTKDLAATQLKPQPETMSLQEFTAFLLSADNAAFLEEQGKVHQDMSKPLSEYFISSSHNTYLIGNQLMGDSTTEGYIRALLQGCRSVELDIWDGDKEPCVYHGKTLTSRVSVREISKAIAKYAFVASPYPVVISAEIHCKIEQQDMVADIMKEEFGAALVTGPLPGREHENETGVKELPSPNELKGKILLKAKKLTVSSNAPMEANHVTVNAESETTETSTSETEEAEAGAFSRALGLVEKVRAKAPGILRRHSPSRPQPGASASGPEKPKISTHLAALLVYTVGVKCRGLNKKEVYDPVHLFSLSERTCSKIMKESMSDLIKHNRTHVIRIYPAGTRLKSSNYEPHRYWACGAHLVAINWQTQDLGAMINYAMFQRNGGCGMVLKPEPLRIKDKEALGTRTKHSLQVKIVSAQQLPRPKDSRGHEIVTKSIVDPFVEVSIHIPDWSERPPTSDKPTVKYSPAKGDSLSSASSARSFSAKTKVVKNNGFNPIWDEDLTLPFDLVGGMKDLVFVRFEVRDKSETEEHPLGIYCVSLGSLQLGYRHLPLHDQQMSQYLFSTLFVKLAVKDE